MQSISLYLHIPFCDRLCPYCDFAVVIRRSERWSEYLDALVTEISTRDLVSDPLSQVSSIYIGGGTPALMEPSDLERLLDTIAQRFSIAPDVEVTLEANPRQVSAMRSKEWAAVGFNRLSIGCQSFQDDVLRFLGRNHDGETSLRALDDAVEYFPGEVSIDLIFGARSGGKTDLKRDFDLLRPRLPGFHHVSAYELTIEEHTRFGVRSRKGEKLLAEEESRVGMLDQLWDFLRKAGFRRYEVSNFSRPGRESRHNQHYWQGGTYHGFGLGAHSMERSENQVLRRANTRDYRTYLANPISSAELEELSHALHWVERCFTALRTAKGVNPWQMREDVWGVPELQFERTIGRLESFVKTGWLSRTGDSFQPTPLGWQFSDSIASAMWDSYEP